MHADEEAPADFVEMDGREPVAVPSMLCVARFVSGRVIDSGVGQPCPR